MVGAGPAAWPDRDWRMLARGLEPSPWEPAREVSVEKMGREERRDAEALPEASGSAEEGGGRREEGGRRWDLIGCSYCSTSKIFRQV